MRDRLLCQISVDSVLSSSGVYSRMSPGWQASALQIALSVENRTAMTFPVFSFERLTLLTPTFSLNSFRLIFRSAMTRSSRRMIAIAAASQCLVGFCLEHCAVVHDFAAEHNDQDFTDVVYIQVAEQGNQDLLKQVPVSFYRRRYGNAAQRHQNQIEYQNDAGDFQDENIRLCEGSAACRDADEQNQKRRHERKPDQLIWKYRKNLKGDGIPEIVREERDKALSDGQHTEERQCCSCRADNPDAPFGMHRNRFSLCIHRKPSFLYCFTGFRPTAFAVRHRNT